MKICSKCKVAKPRSEFNKNRGGKDGLQSQCKICKNTYSKAWHDKNRARSREVSRKYHEANRESVRARHQRWYYATGRPAVLLKAARYRARIANVPFTLTKDWIASRLGGVCEVTGIAFKDRVKKGAGPYSPSIDRIIPVLGYTPENCRMVLFALNVAMRDWGLEVVRELAHALLEQIDD